MEDYRTIIGENIRRHRKRYSLTQEDLAELTGIQPSSVGKIERAQSNPNLTTLLRYADALKIDLPALFIDPNSEKINDCVPNIHLSALPEPNRSAARLLLQVLNDIVNAELDESDVSSLLLAILRLVRHSVFEVTSSSCREEMYSGVPVYGVKAVFYKEGRIYRTEEIADLSTDRQIVEHFVARLNRNFVSYENFRDLLEDFMDDFGETE